MAVAQKGEGELLSSKTVARSSTTASSKAHPLQDKKELLECVRLLDAGKLSSLPKPLPRAQEVPTEFFRTPAVGDQVISVSHAWRNQAHPDPTGQKREVLQEVVAKAILADASCDIGGAPGGTLLFFDFLSIPQRPFRSGQEPRTDEEVSRFQNALSCMHGMFFFSDRVIHLPWDDGKLEIAGEGTDSDVPALNLQGCDLTELGDCVQVSKCPPAAVRSSSKGVCLFDQVLFIDGQPIASAAQVEELLGSGAAKTATVRRYPFGLTNPTPADSRGWVFLERFITMVKCAMMDEATAQMVVITPSEAILNQIMEGANQLREAALKDLRAKQPGELKQVLDSFEKELQRKHFSAASTDKREMESQTSMDGDRELVSGLMRTFTHHLAEHWETEAAKQRGLAKRLTAMVAATDKILLEWDCFSEEYASRLATVSTTNPWPLLLMLVLPPSLAAVYLLFPYARPDEGLEAQAGFVFFGFPLHLVPGYLGFPALLAQTTGVRGSRRLLLLFALWFACALGFSAAALPAASFIVGAFPVPFMGILQGTTFVPTMQFLWCIVPADQHASPHFRRRALVSALSFCLLIGLFGPLFVLINLALPHLSEGWQALVVCGYVAAKLGFEAISVRFSKLLGADLTPLFMFLSLVCYQVNLCVALATVNSPLIVIEQVAFDAIENAYHLWSVWRHEGKGTRQQQYIVASLVLREFVELLVPSHFLALYSLIRRFRPEYSSLLCMRDEQAVSRSFLYVEADIATNFIITCLTLGILWRRGHAPLRLLRGLIATRLGAMLMLTASCLTFYMAMQHSHFGMDLSLEFRWVHDENARWICGFEWEGHEEAMAQL